MITVGRDSPIVAMVSSVGGLDALGRVLRGWFTGQWIYAPMKLDAFHPGYFLPTVAGGLVAAFAAALVGQHQLGEMMFGLGMTCWLIVGSVIMGRLLFRPTVPPLLLPTYAIEVAPPAVATLAYLALNGHRIDFFAAVLAGYGLLMVAAQLRLLPVYLRLSFAPSTWAFTFSWAAVTSAAIAWLELTRPTGYLTWEYVVVAAITALIGGIAIRTLLAVARGTLLPAAASPAAPLPGTREGTGAHLTRRIPIGPPSTLGSR